MSTIPYNLPGRRLLVLITLLVFSLVVLQAAPQTPSRQPSSMILGSTRNAAQITGRIPTVRFGGKSTADKLSKSGPAFPIAFSMSKFTVEGFVKGNWPIVIEYELEADSIAEVTISVKGAKTGFRITLTPTDQRKEVMYRLPEEFGQKPQVGVLSFKALKNGPEPRKPADFFLYSLGVGDKAVGSTVIKQLLFKPGSINTKLKEKASYSFRSINDFTLASADFMLVTKLGASIDTKLVYQEMFNNGVRRGEVVTREWDGKSNKNKNSLGLHQVWVRVWRTLKTGGDWAVGSTTEWVKVV